MGKGDIKSAKGKRTNGSYGNTRKRKSTAKVVVSKKSAETVTEKKVAAKKPAVKKAPVKAAAEKSTASKKVAAKKTTKESAE
jgi:ribosomal small subunit protein bTHX